jgi:hypothetical protein
MKTLIRSSPSLVFGSNTLGTTLMSILVAWVVSSFVFAPVPAAPESGPTASSHHLYQLSPIPAGADWTA